MPIESARRNRSRASACARRIVDVEVGVEGDLRADAFRPEQDPELVALRVLLQERVVVEAQVARLQIDVAGAGLRRNQLAVGDVGDTRSM
jgi:hypothetical protein